MISIPLEAGLILAAILFSIGLVGVLVRRNLIFVLLSVEIMLNASGLAFVSLTARSCLFLFWPWRRQKCRWGWP
jgi:NADH-quinone oxidoreductase subunit K